MSDTIIVALITGAFSAFAAGIGGYFSSKKTTALMLYRLEQLERKVLLHNNLVERTYKLEESTALQEEKIKVANHRIDDLEQTVKF